MTTTQQASKPLPKRNIGEIRGFEKQVMTEGRIKTSTGHHTNIYSWITAEKGLRNGRTYFYVGGQTNATPEAPVTIEYEMQEYELHGGSTGERVKRGADGKNIVKSISLISPTEWFSNLMKGTFKTQHSRRVPRKDAEGNVMKYNNGEDQMTHEYYTKQQPITIQHIIGHANSGVHKLVNDLKIMVTGRLGYPFVNYITSGNIYHSNCRYYGAKTPWGQIKGGDYTASSEYNTNAHKRNNQVQVMGELDDAFMENYNAWMSLNKDLAALVNVDNIKNQKAHLESGRETLAKQQAQLVKISAMWTEEYMMAYATAERDEQLRSQTQSVKWARETVERTELGLKAAEDKDITSVTALQKAHFGKVFRKAKVNNDADN